MADEPKTGSNFKLYRNDGTYAVPVWTLIEAIGDVEMPTVARNMAELKVRMSQWIRKLGALKQPLETTFNFVRGLQSTVFDDLIDDFNNGTVVEYAIVNDAIATAGTQGWRYPAILEEFPHTEPLEEVAEHNVKLSLGLMIESGSMVDPEWMVVAA